MTGREFSTAPALSPADVAPGKRGRRLVTAGVGELVRALAASAAVPRVTLRVEEAATALGVSPDFFDQHVRPEVRLIRRGRLVLVPVDELRRWVERESALPIREQR